MKRFIILTLVLLLGLFYFGMPGKQSKSDENPLPPSFLTSDYSPWESPWLEKIHRSFYLKEATAYYVKGKTFVPLDQIAPSLQLAVLTMEDRKFYDHIGFDWEGILRASLVNLQKGEITEGASTITQQLAKNLFLNQNLNYTRKVEEALLALQMEQNFSKDEIFTLYLNTIYFGSGAYGIGQASQIYFGKEPQTLTLAESAMLAGIIPAPSLYSPYENLELAQVRQGLVLDTMLSLGIITPKQAKDAKNEKLSFAS